MNAWTAGTLFAIGAAITTLVFGGFGARAEDPDAVTGASPVIDSGHPWMRGHAEGESGGMLTQWADELGLTAQQRSDIQIIVADYGTRFRELAELGKESAKRLLNTPPDDPEYYNRTQQTSAVAASSAAEIVMLLAELRGKLYAVLTPDQRQKLEDLRNAKHEAPPEENTG